MPEVQTKLPFDMGRDFVHIGFVAETPMMIGVSPTLGVSSLQEFIAFTKLRPGELFYAANSHGSLPHLTGEMFRKANRRKRHLCPVSQVRPLACRI